MVFCASNDVTLKAERKWSAATFHFFIILVMLFESNTTGMVLTVVPDDHYYPNTWKFISRKRSENLVACYSYWPMSSSIRSRYSNRAVTSNWVVIY